MCYLLISEDSNIIERCRVNKVKLYSVRGIKATTLVQRVLNVPPILKNRIMCLDHRKWNILAFRGRLMSLLELRSVGSHRGLSSHRSLAYSICWIRYTDLHYLVDWNERRRLQRE